MLDLADFGTNPHAAEFGGYGLCRVWFGEARPLMPAGPAGAVAVRARAAGRGQRPEQTDVRAAASRACCGQAEWQAALLRA